MMFLFKKMYAILYNKNQTVVYVIFVFIKKIRFVVDFDEVNVQNVYNFHFGSLLTNSLKRIHFFLFHISCQGNTLT